MRGGVLRYMTRLYPDRALPYWSKPVKDTHYIVRQVAADEAGEIGNAKSNFLFAPPLKDKNADVKQAASTALEIFSRMFRQRLTGLFTIRRELNFRQDLSGVVCVTVSQLVAP